MMRIQAQTGMPTVLSPVGATARQVARLYPRGPPFKLKRPAGASFIRRRASHEVGPLRADAAALPPDGEDGLRRHGRSPKRRPRASGYSRRMSAADFDSWFEESDYTKGEEPKAFAEWLAAQTGTRITGRPLDGSETFEADPPPAKQRKRKKR
jgi:hypothetical protein